MEEQIIKFEDILIGCLRKWRSVLVFTILTTILAGVVSIAATDTVSYEGIAKLYIKNQETVMENGVEVKKDKHLIQNYIELMHTRDFMDMALDTVGLELKAEEAVSKMVVTNVINTDFMQIKYESFSKDETVKAIQGAINQLIEVAPNYSEGIQIILEESIGVSEKQNIRNNKVLILMGLIGGFFMAIAIAFISECTNKTFKTKGELERELKMNILASVPKVKKIQVNNNKGTRLTEAYNNLATTIKYSKGSLESKIVLITGSLVREGSTTTAIGLAMALANGDRKVILVEGDLRKPSLHNVLEVNNESGLTDIILKKLNLDSAIKKINTNLDLISAGQVTQNPIEVIDSEGMDILLSDLKSKYDYIVIDTPPLQAVTDAQILATKVDLTILVVKAEAVKKDIVKASIALIKSVDKNIVGIVFNAADTLRNKFYKYGN